MQAELQYELAQASTFFKFDVGFQKDFSRNGKTSFSVIGLISV